MSNIDESFINSQKEIYTLEDLKKRVIAALEHGASKRWREEFLSGVSVYNNTMECSLCIAYMGKQVLSIPDSFYYKEL